MAYLNWSNEESPGIIKVSEVIPAIVAQGQVQTTATPRKHIINSEAEYLALVSGSALDTSNLLDRYIKMAFSVIKVKPIIIYNVDSTLATTSLTAEIIAGITDIKSSMVDLGVRPFSLVAQESDSQATVRTAMASFAASFDGDHKGRGFYEIVSTASTVTLAIADKSVEAATMSACWGNCTITGITEAVPLAWIASLIHSKETVTKGGLVYQATSNLDIPLCTAYDKAGVTLDTQQTLENGGIMGVYRATSKLRIKGPYTSAFDNSAAATLTADFQSTVDTLSQTENNIRDYVLDYVIDTPLTASNVEQCVGAINRVLGSMVAAGAYKHAYVELARITSSVLTLYLKTAPVPPTTQVNVNNTVETTTITINIGS